MSYTHNIYKIWEEVKTKYTMRIYSLRRHRLKHEWNQTVWSANNLRCGTAASNAKSVRSQKLEAEGVPLHPQIPLKPVCPPSTKLAAMPLLNGGENSSTLKLPVSPTQRFPFLS